MLGLDAIGLRAGTDKASTHHNYLSFYELFFAPLREKTLSILEIGVLNGASLKTWEDYFPHANIIGVDITPASKRFEQGRINIVLADQSNVQELASLSIEQGPFDIVIEDGSHMWEHQITTLRTLFPFLKNDGLYIVEDLQTNYGAMQASYKGVATTSCVEYLKRWVDLRVGDEQIPIENVEDAFLRTYGRAIDFISFYRHACLIKKGFMPRRRELDVGQPLGELNGIPGIVPLTLVAHVGSLGDVLGRSGFVNPGSNLAVQGLLLEGDPKLVEYRVRFSDGSWSDWIQQGIFAGTKGKSIPITGFTIRLQPEVRDSYSLTALGRFTDSERPVSVSDGEDCVSTSGAALCGLQVAVWRSAGGSFPKKT